MGQLRPGSWDNSHLTQGMEIELPAFRHAPLCPAGHLPHKGEIGNLDLSPTTKKPPGCPGGSMSAVQEPLS
ncbi:hypothetical protein GCM10007881_14260 [Mesorhizobium huakuii]|nr:hypothetical protein GCM10007881_14260 [Mesorhizobium huakuii]